jgi:apolipoprotein N-acyltransferase
MKGRARAELRKATRAERSKRLATGAAGIAGLFRGLSGVTRYAVALGAGVLSAGAMAPLYAAPVLYVTIPVLIWLVDGAGTGRRGIRRAALIGEIFGFGFFLAGLYWIGNAFLVDVKTFGWMIPFVAILLPAGLGLFPAAALAASRALWCEGWPRILLFTVFWIAAEWLRGHILTGFPWNLMGYAWGSLLPMLQSVSWWGIYGLSFVTVLTASSVALAGDTEERVGGFDLRLVPAVGLAALLLLGAIGQLRLLLEEPQYVEGVKLRIVHAAVDQAKIDDPAMREPIFANYLALTARPGLDTVTHVIWPEAAVPFVLSRDPAALDAIGQTLPDETVLITGAIRMQHGSGGAPPLYFNSLHALDGEGRILVTYDKAHLVPFGEYLPLSGLLERLGLMKLAGNLGSFARGTGPRTLAVPGAPPFGALICYEIIFPGAVVDPAVRPGWLVNVTDDSWFGSGTGPYQHFESARVRAIEEGIPVVRAANKGVSAIIDPLGRLVAVASPASVGVLDGGLPRALPQTLYIRTGNALLLAFTILASIFGVMGARRRIISGLVTRALYRGDP